MIKLIGDSLKIIWVKNICNIAVLELIITYIDKWYVMIYKCY